MSHKGFLELEDGTRFEGVSFGSERSIAGECVFQTGMVGYPESLTDPSYRGQILVMTFPLIGNYGVPPHTRDEKSGLLKYFESEKIWISGLIVSDYSDQPSHWNSVKTLSAWLKENNIPALYGVDTRALTKKIRERGVLLGKIEFDEKINLEDPNKRNLVDEVSTKEVKVYGEGDKTILAIDCGMKDNQLRCLLERKVRIKRVPWNHDITKETGYDGIFISNGPGDPTMCLPLVNRLKELLKREPAIPIFGICMGNQILGLAAGAKTYKMKYGNRGQNQPCTDLLTGRCHLTSQNHGFAVDTDSLPSDWEPFFINANDKTNEGIRHKTKPFFSVQFHPEAKGGPVDTFYLFDQFLSMVRGVPFTHPLATSISAEPVKVSKVLLLGSGGISIGQAGEFDYSGSQAIKALKEEGVQIILINPNIATVQTTSGLADKVYFLPVTPEFVIKVIEAEQPDGILVTFGGQTALNCGLDLWRRDIFNKYNVKVLGTPMQSIESTEDRKLFAEAMAQIGERIAPSIPAHTLSEALDAADKIGYPVIVRASYALGGLGSGFANNNQLVSKTLTMVSQVLIEKSLKGWKEMEYEVVRDCRDNCITVTNMENFDPLGIHTGESIVVAPSQTLNDTEYHMLRAVSIKVIRHLKIVGECNIQFAMDPFSEEYYIIEVNARLSRSSAFASKATGYPLAFVAAKLALGWELPQLKNSVTKVTTACFEPSLDYVVVKMPIWDLSKFYRVDTHIDSSMKSVGEVMAIGRTFEEAIQKAIRMAYRNVDGFQPGIEEASEQDLEFPNDKRILVIASALKANMTVDQIYKLTKIDKWFLYKLKKIIDLENKLANYTTTTLDEDFLRELKKNGFSDKQIARILNSTELAVRDIRESKNVFPVVKQIDTVAAEVKAQNNYLYITYNGTENDVEFNEHGHIVIGSGGYRIGSSVEFDWCAVGAISTLKKLGYRTIMINFNPETVSTDYDVCDRLYFEELTLERVLDIYRLEDANGVVVSMGGQIPNNLAIPLMRQKVKILGTSPDMIDAAENRYKFSRLLDHIGVNQPQWKELSNLSDVSQFCDSVGYPVIVRPSYVLSGAAMNVVYSSNDLTYYLTEATSVSPEHPVVISKLIQFAKEIEVDAVAKDGELVMHCISEHVENAGVHSGDATLVFPAQDLDQETISQLEDATRKIAKALEVTGPINIQFLAKDDKIMVIECNLRASRSFPFVSKTLQYNLIDMATRVIVGASVKSYPVKVSDVPYVGVKAAQFSFSRLKGADFVLGVEMASTGEVACFGNTRQEALMKALLATGFKLPKKNVFISIGSFKEKQEFLEFAKKLVELRYNLFGSHGTADFLLAHNVQITALDWEDESENSIDSLIKQNEVHLCIICPSIYTSRRNPNSKSHGYIARRKALDFNIPLLTNIKVAKLFVDSLWLLHGKDLHIADCDFRESKRVAILPGLIDVHVHVREPGQTHKEDWNTCSAAALAGGITIIGAMPNTQPSVIDAITFEQASLAAEAQSRCDYGLFLGASSDNMQTASHLAGNAFAMKMYLDQTFSTLKLDNVGIWNEHFKNWPKESVICCHAEGRNVPAVLFLASLHNRSVHICHVARKEEIEIIRQAKLQNVKVTCEVAPHHLFLTQEEAEKTLGKKRSQVRPPLATSADVKALWDNMDIIDVIATDHAPHTVTEKDSENAPPGFPGLETCLPLMLTAVHEGRLTIQDIIEKMHVNPRKIFNIPEQPNTYVEVVLDESWKIPEAMPYSKCKWTPFAGRNVIGKVRKVVLRGEVAYLDGKGVLALPGTGKDIRKSVTPAITISSPGKPVEHPKPVSLEVSTLKKSTGEFKTSIPTAPAPLEKQTLRISETGLKGRSILTVKQFSREDLRVLFNLASHFRRNPLDATDVLKGRILVSLFFEPSTRTAFSFMGAMQKLGGSSLNFNEQFSSTQKGETFEDTIRAMECYGDVIAIRHPNIGSALQASKVSRKPVINAGDGAGEHPTQALLDVFTIREELGTVNGLTVTFVGDLKYGRTVHSLVQLLSVYNIAHVYYVSPPELAMPSEIISQMNKFGLKQSVHTSLSEVISKTDVLYVTRIQKERFTDMKEYERVKDSFVITPKTLAHAKERMIIMHPLPRVNEISTEVDSDPRAAYFRQMENGVYVRMALLALVLGANDRSPS